MHDRVLAFRRAQLLGLLEQQEHRRRDAPEAEQLDLLQRRSRTRNENGHVGAAVAVRWKRVDADRIRDLAAVEDAQEVGELDRDAVSAQVLEVDLAELASGKELAACERPREL